MTEIYLWEVRQIFFGKQAEGEREHDKIYLEDDSFFVKESFKAVLESIREARVQKVGQSAGDVSLLDVGAGNGSFLEFLAKQEDSWRLSGLEIRGDLVERAKAKFGPIATFVAGDLQKGHLFEIKSFDVITALGTLSIFDDLRPVLSNLRKWLSPGGLLVVHGMFNPSPVDVWVRYREVGSQVGPQAGWNIVSEKTFENLCLANGFDSVTFHSFNPSLNLSPNPEDPLRSWTERSADNGRIEFFNGLSIRQPQAISVVFG